MLAVVLRGKGLGPAVGDTGDPSQPSDQRSWLSLDWRGFEERDLKIFAKDPAGELRRSPGEPGAPVDNSLRGYAGL